jgi:hypothetical protein
VDTRSVVRAWVDALPEPATSELVRPGFWYVRLPGESRRWIPMELDLRERSLKVTSHVIVEPDEDHAEVYAFLLRHNHAARGVAFSIDGKEGVICLVGRIPLERLDVEGLDELVGRIVEATEETFRSILSIGFATRLKRR